MTITSQAFKNNQNIPDIYTCNGENVNPPLLFSEVPQQAKALVLIVDDPDAPAGIWVHWSVFNIDPASKGVEENGAFASGSEGMTSSGRIGYGGPCPPSGTHRYFFKLYALDTVLNLAEKAGKTLIEQQMQGHIIDQAELIGLYSKK